MKTHYTPRPRLLQLVAALALTSLTAWASPPPGSAPRVGDYQSAGSGDYADLTTWEVFVAGPSGTASDGFFIAASALPTAASGTITIREFHTVTFTSPGNTTLNEIVVDTGGTISHENGNLIISATPGEPYDLIVQGTYRELSSTGRLAPALGAGVFIDESGTWRHSANGGTVPTALWASNSLLLFDGIVSATTLASTARLGQPFGRITWNCPAQTSVFAFGPLSSEPINVSTVATGDMRVLSTGAGTLQLSSPLTGSNVRADAGYEQLDGRVTVNAAINATRTFNVGLDFTLRGGSFIVQTANNTFANAGLVVTGNLSIVGGILNITNSPRPGSVTVTGGVGLSSAGSRLRSTGGGTATFNFAPGPSRLFSNVGAINGPIIFNVNGGSTVDFGTFALFGAGTFTLSEGAVGYFGSPSGISAAGQPDAGLGNIQVNSFRTYSPLGYYFYTGTVSQQTGSGLPLEIGTLSDSLIAGGLGIANAVATNTVTLTRPLRMNGELQLRSGRLVTTPTTKITLSRFAFLNDTFPGSADSYVQGIMNREMDRDELYSYPIGDSGYYRPVDMRLRNTDRDAAYDITAIYGEAPNSTMLATSGAQRIDSLLGDTYWPIARTSGTTVGIIRIPFTPGLLADETFITIAGYNTNTMQWEDLGLEARDLTANWVEAPVPPRYSMVALARAAEDVLPVELMRFAATRRGSSVDLTWATATERNSAWFVVERSASGNEFNEVTRVAAAGNSTRELSYTASDLKPLTGTSYYRLRQVDQDGSVAYSGVVAVRGGNGPSAVFSLYPNPATDALNVQLPTAASGTTVRVVNSLGQVVLTQTLDASASQCSLNISALPGGSYVVTVAAPGQPTVSQRLLKTAQ